MMGGILKHTNERHIVLAVRILHLESWRMFVSLLIV
jgi:hypothetical protein